LGEAVRPERPREGAARARAERLIGRCAPGPLASPLERLPSPQPMGHQAAGPTRRVHPNPRATKTPRRDLGGRHPVVVRQICRAEP
jgi:hypothetical protein